MRALCFTVVSFALVSVACTPSEPKSALDTVLVEGRAQISEAGVRLSFPGSQLKLATPSNEISLEFDFENAVPDRVFDYQVNGGGWTQQPVPAQGTFSYSLSYPIRDGRGMKVDIIRRTEAWQGDMIFKTAVAEEGFIAPDPLPKIKLLFIGDSITAGAGTTFRYGENSEKIAASNARLAYPRVLGDRLNAQVHHVAYGGRGLVRDWQGITETNNAPQFYDRVLPDNPDLRWDPADYQADIVSVMLGTNDFNQGIPERESWTQAYRDFVTRIRSDYPKAQVFLISSPMTGGEKGGVLKAYVKEVAESFETPSVQYLQVGQYFGEAWDSHPTAAEHQKIADELEAEFRAALGE